MPIEIKMIPKKSLGQNFLIDKNIAKKITNLIKIENKVIVEVGSGTGFLTDFIIKKSPKKLIIIEKDNKLFNYLKSKYKNEENVYIFNKDILKFKLTKLSKINLISNLPYNISKNFILKILKNKNVINEMVIMLQKEVALKYNYNQGKLNKYKFLVSLCSNYKICFKVSKNVFLPKPKIDSAIVKFKFNKKNIDWEKTDNFVKMIFNNRRKIIKNNINFNNKIDLSSIMNKRVDQIELNEILKIYNLI